MSGRERLRLDDWMRPVRGDRYVERLPEGDGLPAAPGRRRRRGRRAVTPRDRRLMAWTLLVLPLVAVAVGLLIGPSRGASALGALTGVAVGQAVQLYRSRDVGWH